VTYLLHLRSDIVTVNIPHRAEEMVNGGLRCRGSWSTM
jgi:hypothetical protein